MDFRCQPTDEDSMGMMKRAIQKLDAYTRQYRLDSRAASVEELLFAKLSTETESGPGSSVGEYKIDILPTGTLKTEKQNKKPPNMSKKVQNSEAILMIFVINTPNYSKPDINSFFFLFQATFNNQQLQHLHPKPNHQPPNARFHQAPKATRRIHH